MLNYNKKVFRNTSKRLKEISQDLKSYEKKIQLYDEEISKRKKSQNKN